MKTKWKIRAFTYNLDISEQNRTEQNKYFIIFRLEHTLLILTEIHFFHQGITYILQKKYYIHINLSWEWWILFSKENERIIEVRNTFHKMIIDYRMRSSCLNSLKYLNSNLLNFLNLHSILAQQSTKCSWWTILVGSRPASVNCRVLCVVRFIQHLLINC